MGAAVSGMIAIHHRQDSFSEHWVNYCKANQIPFKLVNAYDSDILTQLKGIDVFMWHFSQNQHADMLFAKSLIKSLEQMGIKTFPSYNDCWHFDDKLAQKYLIESINVPFAKVEVYYDKHIAQKRAAELSYPVVFKLSTGAGSQHVKMMQHEGQLRRTIQKLFAKGYSTYNRWDNFTERVRKWRSGLVGIGEPIKGLIRLFKPPDYGKLLPHEKGYVYLQEFIPQNDSDFRVIVIGKKAFAIKRMVRKGDFRASGSGEIKYEKRLFKNNLIQMAFDISNKLTSTCMAYDFVYDDKGNPLLIEMSYGFATKGYEDCEGYWDDQLNWHQGKFNPYGWMLEEIINLKQC